MRRALPFLRSEVQLTKNPIKWAALPEICCQAVGGDPHDVIGFTSAWLLYYVAAHLMDKVEDQDEQEGPWSEWGPGASINIASGLYFTASLLLTDLYTHKKTASIAFEINRDFYRSFLQMCSGQQRDLTQLAPSLSNYWNNAADKSGVFFSIACRLGARLGTSKKQLLDEYETFGRQVGTLIQVLDDLEEYQESGAGFKKVSFQVLRKSLPVIYALEVLPEPEAALLINELKQAEYELAAREAFERIDRSGASYYILTEIERLREQAKTSLERAQPMPPADGALYGLLGELTYQF